MDNRVAIAQELEQHVITVLARGDSAGGSLVKRVALRNLANEFSFESLPPGFVFESLPTKVTPSLGEDEVLRCHQRILPEEMRSSR